MLEQGEAKHACEWEEREHEQHDEEHVCFAVFEFVLSNAQAGKEVDVVATDDEIVDRVHGLDDVVADGELEFDDEECDANKEHEEKHFV